MDQYAALSLRTRHPQSRSLLSYRHSFHAGNLADVLKHSILTALLDAATAKPAPMLYIDTHAGAGVYQFDDASAARTEHCGGIDPLRAAVLREPPRSIVRYLDCVGSFNAGPSTVCYPGSAMIAAYLLRDIDRLLLCERHPADADALAHALRADPRVRIEFGDGYVRLKAALPPRERRGVILIDPAYELADEPIQVIEGMRAALSRFGHGVYLVWYPLHGKHDHATLKRHFRRLNPPKTLCIELDPRSPAARGATGSGVLVVNPPFQSIAELEALTRFLGRTLTPGGRATCEWLIAE
jgi:23S rRNA (adenine2030-N6)-methyltransferase